MASETTKTRAKLWSEPTDAELREVLAQRYPAVRDRLAELHRTDEAAFSRACGLARQFMDPSALEAIAEILAGEGRLGQWDALCASASLLAHGRADQALDVLLTASPGPKIKKFELRLASSLASIGLFLEAYKIAQRVLHEDPRSARAAYLSEVLHRAIKHGRRFWREPSWPLARPFIDCCIELDAEAETARAVRCLLGQDLPDDDGGFVDMHVALEAGLAAGVDPAAIRQALDRALSVRGDDRELRALRSVCDVKLEKEDLADSSDDADAPSARGIAGAMAVRRRGDHVEAIRRLSRLNEAFPINGEIRHALSHCVGESLIAEVKPRFRETGSGRLINVLTYCNEVELLKLHLSEMADWVDHFVIVEADRTFAGAAKPMSFPANQHLFSEFASKTTYLPVSIPEHLTTHWSRDFYQRDSAIRALPDLCGADDHVLITDVDEIVDFRALEGFSADIAGLRMRTFRFFLNYGRTLGGDRTGAIVRARLLERWGVSHVRFALSRRHADGPRVPNAGWHFSTIGAADTIIRKFQNYAHQEHATKFRSSGHVDEALEMIRGGKLGRGWARFELDDSFPRYIREHRDALADLIL